MTWQPESVASQAARIAGVRATCGRCSAPVRDWEMVDDEYAKALGDAEATEFFVPTRCSNVGCAYHESPPANEKWYLFDGENSWHLGKTNSDWARLLGIKATCRLCNTAINDWKFVDTPMGDGTTERGMLPVRCANAHCLNRRPSGGFPWFIYDFE